MGSISRVSIGVAVLLLAAGVAAGESAAPSKIVHREPGMFGEILVIDEGEQRFLRFGSVEGDDQSMISLKDPRAVPMDYIRYAAIGLAYTPEVDRVLMVGLGGLLNMDYSEVWDRWKHALSSPT